MKTLYLYVHKDDLNECIKYGIKLSEQANKVIKIKNIEKKGIIAYLSPKDSNKYYDENFICLKIKTNNLKIYIYNNSAFEFTNDNDFICDISNYKVGSYEEPIAIICSTILPENISLYNKIMDIPLLIENSKDYYYKKSIFDMLESDFFTNFEVYQLLLILGQKKQLLKTDQVNDKLKIYIDKKNGKKYTKKSNF